MIRPRLVAVGLVALGCGGPPASKAPEVIVQGKRPESVARCEFEGRTDRDVQESSAPGSIVANVRRVYGYIGEGEDRRRVLLCREVDTNFDGVKDVVRTYNDFGQQLNEQADSDYDGKIDTWITFAKSRPAVIEIDHDGDGKGEERTFYVNGRLSRVERDTNNDGKADVFEIYRDGTLDRMGVDVNFDGQVDRWERDEVAARAQAEKDAAAERAAEDAAGQDKPQK
jgi:hypothetical protein